jgi:hypothetical protein
MKVEDASEESASKARIADITVAHVKLAELALWPIGKVIVPA